MARIRTIKPEFWTDEDMAELSEPACLLAIGLLNYADDEGYFNANPKLIKAAVFPIREPSVPIPVLITCQPVTAPPCALAYLSQPGVC